MGTLDIAVKAVERLLNWRSGKNQAARESATDYVQDVDRLCRALIEIDDAASDRARLLHEELKVIYDSASSQLGTVLPAHHVEIVMKALAGARMYYWIRVFHETPSAELMSLSRQNEGRWRRGGMGSIDPVLVAYAQGSLTRDLAIEMLRDDCLYYMARLRTIRRPRTTPS